MSELRIRVIGQAFEQTWVTLVIPVEDQPIDLEVTYPDGTLVRYAKDLD
jgi:hypothetical protein